MKLNIFKLFLILSLSLGMTACAHSGKPQTDSELSQLGAVVEFSLGQGALPKKGIQALSEKGYRLFGKQELNSRGGGVNGMNQFPRWARITWREGPDNEIGFDGKRGGYVGGTIVGDYKVDILNRIPEDVFNYATAAKGRVIVLRFRVKDNGVLFAWDVQESGLNGRGLIYKMHGGDFLDPEIYNGKVIDPGWEK